MPELKKEFAEAGTDMDRFSDTKNSVYDILKALIQKQNELIDRMNSHTHDGGSAQDQSDISKDVTVE